MKNKLGPSNSSRRVLPGNIGASWHAWGEYEDILLDNLVGLEIEVSFAEIYINQPLFSLSIIHI